MNSVFVIQNQDGNFLSRQKEWVDKTQIQAVYKTPHRDLAVNEWVELTARETQARAKVVAVETTARGLPLLATLPPLEFPRAALPEDLVRRNDSDSSNTTDEESTAGAAEKPGMAGLENAQPRTDIRHVS